MADNLQEFLPEQVVEFFEYLDELRESGVTNMFGASAYLQNAFNMDAVDARAVLGAWMETFDRDVSATARARKALAAMTARALLYAAESVCFAGLIYIAALAWSITP